VTSHDDAAESRMAAIYARVSTEDQGKGFSLPTQIEACQKVAEHEGYRVPEAYILVDAGASGATLNRPALSKLRELVASQAIAAVVIYDVDRLSRNTGHLCILVEELQQAGVLLLGRMGPIEHTPEGTLLFQM
jgi:site-specific DNA recombinase